MIFDPLKNHRIPMIDDNRDAHEDFRKILISSVRPDPLNKHEAALFGDMPESSHWPVFQIDPAYQGEECLELIAKSLRESRPYALAFVDVRMPPGWDGIEATCKIWEKYPDLQVVICTAYSDFSWKEMVVKMGHLDRVVILKKPFDNIEVLQLAVAMTEKLQLNQQTELRVDNLEKLVKSGWSP